MRTHQTDIQSCGGERKAGVQIEDMDSSKDETKRNTGH